jgi:2-phosphoglycerate kinase
VYIHSLCAFIVITSFISAAYTRPVRHIAIASGGGPPWPFSKGLVVESLLSVGIERKVALAIARRIERRLLDGKKRVIDAATLKHKVAKQVAATLGTEWGERFIAQTTAFEDILVLAEDGSALPFSKGLLARSLEQVGLGTQAAYDWAKRIERQLRAEGLTELSAAALERRVAEVLTTQDPSMGRVYRERSSTTARIGVLADNGAVLPYSKGIMAQSLMATGLDPSDAHRMAREVETHLLQHGGRNLRRSSLRPVVTEILERQLGPEAALRYRLLRSLRHPNRPVHILIGGVTGTGKSLLAAEIAYRLGITRVESTDSVRQVMRAMVSPELLPALHASTFDAWTTILEPHEASALLASGKPDPAQVVAGFRDQVAQVTVGVRALIERSSQEHTNLAMVVPMVVVVRGEEEHRQRFYSRDLETQQHRPMERYLEHFGSIRSLQAYVEGMAKAVGVPIIEDEGVEAAAEAAIDIITQKILAMTETISDL